MDPAKAKGVKVKPARDMGESTRYTCRVVLATGNADLTVGLTDRLARRMQP